MQKTIDDTHDAVTRLQDGQAQIKEQQYAESDKSDTWDEQTLN